MHQEKELFHICSKTDWESSPEDTYEASSIAQEGFIHCSTEDQLLGTANLIFQGQEDLVLLFIDSTKVVPKIVYEDTVGAGMLFPHIYGALNKDAVQKVLPFKPNEEGNFTAIPE